MPTIRLDLGYDGTGFRGYARQDGHPTVQGQLEKALATILGEEIITAVAGRTDAGVHARGQVASFEFDGEVDTHRLLRSVNGLVGPEVVVSAASVVNDDFHARHSAKWRRYRYRMGTNPTPDPLTRHYTWEVGRRLDLEVMNQVVAVFVGEQDFSSFCRQVEDKSNVRRVEESYLAVEDGVVYFWIKANAFCQQMVRSLMGYTYDVGRGFAPADRAQEVIAARDRSAVATVAPPHGLTLWEVGY